MPIFCRQICLVAEHHAATVNDIGQVLGIKPCHQDPEVAKFGLENSLFALGSQFLEIVSPIQPNTAAGRFIAKRRHQGNGDGGYMVICQATDKNDQVLVRERAAQHNVRVAYESDRGSWNIMQLHPRDMGAAFLEVDWDEQADPQGNWQPAGGATWRDIAENQPQYSIQAIELQALDPLALAEKWSAITGSKYHKKNNGFMLTLANMAIRFTAIPDQDTPSKQSQLAGLTTIDIAVSDLNTLNERAANCGLSIENNQILLCGTRFRFLAL
ncbi:VOC family protein [Aurantivibrio plasticivorans]